MLSGLGERLKKQKNAPNKKRLRLQLRPRSKLKLRTRMLLRI